MSDFVPLSSLSQRRPPSFEEAPSLRHKAWAAGFDPDYWYAVEWDSAVKGNAYGEYNYTLNENGKLVEYRRQPEDYGTDVYVNKAAGFIQSSAQNGKPFFAYVAVYAPHGPATPAPRHAVSRRRAR